MGDLKSKIFKILYPATAASFFGVESSSHLHHKAVAAVDEISKLKISTEVIKDKLHTISDADAEHAAKLLLKSAMPYVYTYDKIERYKYDPQHGVDAEECVSVFFYAKVSHESYRQVGWKDVYVMVKLVEHDKYNESPYFVAYERDVDSENKMNYPNYRFLSNQVEAIYFLQNNGLI